MHQVSHDGTTVSVGSVGAAAPSPERFEVHTRMGGTLAVVETGQPAGSQVAIAGDFDGGVLEVRAFDRRDAEVKVAIRYDAAGRIREVYLAPDADIPLVSR